MDVIIWTSGQTVDDHYVPYRYLGPYKIAHSCRTAGYQVQVIDFITSMDEDRLYQITCKFINNDTVVLAISTTFLCQRWWYWPDGTRARIPYHLYRVLNRIKAEHPTIMIILGGYQSDAVARSAVADASVNQYGEDIFVDVINHLKKGTPEPPFEMRPTGYDPTYKRKTYLRPLSIKHNIQSDNHLFTDQDCIIPGETLPIEISRGCIFSCKFCNHLLLGRGKLDYLRSFECVEAEMCHNHAKWGITNYFVICDTFNDTETKMKAWHSMVSRLPFKIQYTAYLRADLLHRFQDVPYLLKETGLATAYHGIESLGVEASQIVGKGWSGKHAREWIPTLYHDIWGKKVLQHLSFIVGLPGDTKESLVDTVYWFAQNDLYSAVMQTLNINRKIGNHSEFERNHAKYGFRFPNDNIDMWETDYWTQQEASEFNINILTPMLNKHNAWLKSWDILALMSLGYKLTDFDKTQQRPGQYVFVAEEIKNRHAVFVTQYNQLLDSI
jgi:radical SAM superfamily enzyme YgiQ (UPF0313 family)